MSDPEALRLILTRHAKSGWDDPALRDHERPLSPRGQRNAGALGKWLAKWGDCPDQVLCSDATRTLQTWSIIATLCRGATDVRLVPSLYNAAPQTLLAQLHKASGRRVMLIAHNPGIGLLAHSLARTAPQHPRFDDYPSAATLVLDFKVRSWADVVPASGRVVDFVVPRDLP